MGFRNHGYYGYTFVGARVAQFMSLIAIIGLVSNFLSVIAKAKAAAPQEIIATLVVNCIAVLWVLLSFTAYDDSHIPYMCTAIADALFLIPYIVVSVYLGNPLASTTCSDLPQDAQQGSFLAVPVSAAKGNTSEPISYVFFVGGDQTTCYELNAVWGLMICICILFTLSFIAAAFLFIGKRRAGFSTGFFGRGSNNGYGGSAKGSASMAGSEAGFPIGNMTPPMPPMPMGGRQSPYGAGPAYNNGY